mmetsp:Transcript_5850/g.17614  ORF Transcript_5850/g.17614 Transcript_5850/m.17614 type:complete len:243 (+) Transcript_5850:894-1622(+)
MLDRTRVVLPGNDESVGRAGAEGSHLLCPVQVLDRELPGGTDAQGLRLLQVRVHEREHAEHEAGRLPRPVVGLGDQIPVRRLQNHRKCLRLDLARLLKLHHVEDSFQEALLQAELLERLGGLVRRLNVVRELLLYTIRGLVQLLCLQARVWLIRLVLLPSAVSVRVGDSTLLRQLVRQRVRRRGGFRRSCIVLAFYLVRPRLCRQHERTLCCRLHVFRSPRHCQGSEKTGSVHGQSRWRGLK